MHEQIDSGKCYEKGKDISGYSQLPAEIEKYGGSSKAHHGMTRGKGLGMRPANQQRNLLIDVTGPNPLENLLQHLITKQ